jgi:hypothetical protein
MPCPYDRAVAAAGSGQRTARFGELRTDPAVFCSQEMTPSDST